MVDQERVTTIEIQHEPGGQPRPYADSFWGAVITAQETWTDDKTRELRTKPTPLPRAAVHHLVQAFVAPFANHDEGSWASARLVACEPLGRVWPDRDASDRWRVRVQQPYVD